MAVDAAAQERLLGLVELLARWSRAYNLTAVRDPFEMIPRHLLDSLAVQPFLFGDSILDLGTGAGFPGLPLAILEPQRRFWLLDSSRKKLRFVRQAVLELALENVELVHARIQTYRPGRNFSTIVSRAVAVADLLGAGTPDLLTRPGRMLLMRGREPDVLTLTQGPFDLSVRLHRLRIPSRDVERHLIELRND
ncbi:MAG: 16S rRNA (guanine(527)-N(7))-methyltransferase RsmG [Thiocapsa sp.]|nr:16S rRNA (guanine(527)-N(7))-methyltransferase RsmG [Thiocapsa sp.]MCG6896351.1 16S rRNA (guanine(527)-N(7))-methyltransferase RsmG [Thiocapsa sp.]